MSVFGLSRQRPLVLGPLPFSSLPWSQPAWTSLVLTAALLSTPGSRCVMVAAICLVGINAIFKWLLFSSCSTKLERAGEFQAETEPFLPKSSVSWAGHNRLDRSSVVGTSLPCRVGAGDRGELCHLLWPPPAQRRHPRRASELCRFLRECGSVLGPHSFAG